MRSQLSTKTPQVIFIDPTQMNTALVPVPQPQPRLLEWTTDERALDRRALINLSKLLNSPLDGFKIVERCDRIRLIEFKPVKRPDPLMPIPAFEIPTGLADAMRHYIRVVCRWSPSMGSDDQYQWHRVAQRCLNSLTAQISRFSGRFTAEEAEFMLDHLEWCLVSPDGRNRM